MLIAISLAKLLAGVKNCDLVGRASGGKGSRSRRVGLANAGKVLTSQRKDMKSSCRPSSLKTSISSLKKVRFYCGP